MFDILPRAWVWVLGYLESLNKQTWAVKVPGDFFWARPKSSSLIEQWKNPGYLLYKGDYTTQFYRDCNKPL